MNRYDYMVATGWWCSPKGPARRNAGGDDTIRGAEFHRLWYSAVDRYLRPGKIVMVDSASPVRPPLKSDPRIEFISLPLNAGHAVEHTGKYCGWTRAVLLGLEYCLLSDFDYFVYVEQDVLLYGEGLIDKCIKRMRTPFMFGAGAGTPSPVQQSFFIVRRDGISEFVHEYMRLAPTDHRLFPEYKFSIAASPLLRRLPTKFFLTRTGRFVSKRVKAYDELPFGYGRVRPIDWRAPHFYFQHGTKEELDRYMELTGLHPMSEEEGADAFAQEGEWGDNASSGNIVGLPLGRQGRNG